MIRNSPPKCTLSIKTIINDAYRLILIKLHKAPKNIIKVQSQEGESFFMSVLIGVDYLCLRLITLLATRVKNVFYSRTMLSNTLWEYCDCVYYGHRNWSIEIPVSIGRIRKGCIL